MKIPPVPPPPHLGGCLCGAVRYRIDGAPLATVACHCRDCQKLTGATNLLTVYFDSAAFRHEGGALANYRKRAESGREADYARCAACGTRLWHRPLATPQWVMIAAGTLDEPGWVVPAAHIWVSRAAPSACIPDAAARWARGPSDRSELIAAFAAARETAAPPAGVINLAAKLATFSDHYHPRTVGTFNDHDLMVVKLKGPFTWHKHDETDDFFLVLKGRLRIELRDRVVELGPGEIFVVPKGVEHRPVADEEVHLLLIEPTGTPNTGDRETAAPRNVI